MQLHHVAHARGGRWRVVRKDLLHNPAGNAALLRDLGLLRSIVIVIPRLRLQCCKEVEGGESGCNVIGAVELGPLVNAAVAASKMIASRQIPSLLL